MLEELNQGDFIQFSTERFIYQALVESVIENEILLIQSGFMIQSKIHPEPTGFFLSKGSDKPYQVNKSQILELIILPPPPVPEEVQDNAEKLESIQTPSE